MVARQRVPGPLAGGHELAEGPPGQRGPPAGPRQLERRRLIFFKFACMAVVFVCALGGLVALYLNLPGLDGDARAELEAVAPSSFYELSKLRDLRTLRKLCAAVGVYRQQHPIALALLLSYLYLLYQAFPLFMFPFSGLAMAVTVLLGALYDSWFAFGLASLLSAVGPSLAFFLFKATGKPLVVRAAAAVVAAVAAAAALVAAAVAVTAGGGLFALLSHCLSVSLYFCLCSELRLWPFVRLFSAQLQRMRRLVHPAHSSSSSDSSSSASGKLTSVSVDAKEEATAASDMCLLPNEEQQQQKQDHKRFEMDLDLMLTILFLRVSPFPNLVINAASPVLDVPFGAFFVATWLGLMPNAALFVSMGSALGSIDSLSSGWRPLVVFVVGSAAVALLKAGLRKLRPPQLQQADLAAAAATAAA
ncbi:hypothetical protein Esti_004365 [Eimeria stiedai]